MLEDHKRPKPVVIGTLLTPVQDRGPFRANMECEQFQD